MFPINITDYIVCIKYLFNFNFMSNLFSFLEPVAQRLLAEGQIQFDPTLLKIVPPTMYGSNDGADEDSATVEVTGIPKKMNCELLTIFLENERCGGGEIHNIVFDDGEEKAVVTFK